MDIFEKILSKGDFIRRLKYQQSPSEDIELHWQRFVTLFLFHLTNRIAYGLPKPDQHTLIRDINPKSISDISAFMKRTLHYVKTHPTVVNINEVASISAQDAYQTYFSQHFLAH